VIDFNALVLGPCMSAFARPIIVKPMKSQPSRRPYEVQGILTIRNIDVQLDDNSIMSSQVITVGIRLSDFETPPAQGDQIDIPAYLSLPALGPHLVDDGDDDGNGGSVLTLKAMP
jgi:hypothetical protein